MDVKDSELVEELPFIIKVVDDGYLVMELTNKWIRFLEVGIPQFKLDDNMLTDTLKLVNYKTSSKMDSEELEKVELILDVKTTENEIKKIYLEMDAVKKEDGYYYFECRNFGY